MATPITDAELIGYADRLSVEAGEAIRFMVSTTEDVYDVEIVRLIHGDEHPTGPGSKEETISAAVTGRYPGRQQATHPGSYLIVDELEPFQFASFTLQTWIAPTTPGGGRAETIMGRWYSEEGAGYGLFMDTEGVLALWIGGQGKVAVVQGEVPLRAREWFFAAATFDAETGRGAIEQASLSPWDRRGLLRVEVELDRPSFATEAPFRIAAAGVSASDPRAVSHVFNGKIDSPSVFRRSLPSAELSRLREGTPPQHVDKQALVAAWNFAANQSSVTIEDYGPFSLHARAVNMPARAVTGRNWRGREVDYRHVPAEYTAIHFHTDDLEDAQWNRDFEWEVPAGLTSGLYAAMLRTPDLSDHIPFVIRPSTSAHRAKILLLLPTLTYIAYANERVGDSYQTYIPPDWVLEYDPLDRYLERHPEFGKSLYDVHDDLSGVHYSSALRPIPNLRPRYRHRNVNAARHLAGDLYLIDWLEEKGFDYDVVTDGDLHRQGRELLDQYGVLLTGGHPEYWTTPMLESLESWVYESGRLMYLGGNGFYWVTSVHPERPHVIEVRRGIAGSRPWESQPGELHHSTTGEPGGLWRYRGKLPNRLTGVAYAAEGGGVSSGYTRTDASYDEAGSWVFSGVTEREQIGSFGLVMGGAAGDEVDRADPHLGTPADAIVLASSRVLPYYGVAVEDAREFRGGRSVGEARADMVLLDARNGGAVFSVGSISWCGSLSHNSYDNDVSQITENVLRRFADLERSDTTNNERSGPAASQVTGDG